MSCKSSIPIVVLLCASGIQRLAAGESTGNSLGWPPMPISISTPVSESFRRQTSAAIQTIPAPVLQVIETAGWRIRLAEFVIDAQPNLVNDRPRGWPADATWQNSDAVHLPADRLLILAEKRRTRSGQVVAAARVDGVLRHELGHAFDMVTAGTHRFRSASQEFRRAYAADVRRMSPVASQKLAYYLQGADAGRQEAFAEAFGIHLGGGSDPPHFQIFRASFPEVLEFVRRDLTRVGH